MFVFLIPGKKLSVMWSLARVFLLIAGFSCVKSRDFQLLTENFFENLKGHPVFEAQDVLNEGSKNFIESQIDNYVNLVTGAANLSKKKRSLLDKYTKNDKGVYLLSGLEPSATIPVRFPQDAVFFTQDYQTFVAALESAGVMEIAQNLVIFSVHENEITEVGRVSVTNGTKLAVINTGNVTLIAVAENGAPRDNFQEKSGIFQFDSSGLFKIQSIDMHYASDIVMWKLHNEIYMSIGQFMSNNSGIHYETEIPIYKWLGRHFDLVQSIEGKGVRKIAPFVAEGGYFLAVANSRDDSGNTRIYSEIYKFDYHSEKYDLYQRILTKACVDVEVFTFSRDFREDTYLAVANLYEVDSDGEKNYETDSIIYKFVDGYFIPFQSLKMNAVEHWFAVQGVLFASTRFEGLKSFQYDGWIFREVPYKTTLLKGPGIKSVRSVNASTILVSNKNNNVKVPNVFRLEFTHREPLNDIYDDLMTWCDRGIKKVEDWLNDEIFDTVLGKPERADIDEDDFEEVTSRMDSLSSVLDQLKVEEMTANEIVFNNVTFVRNMNTTRINDLSIDDILENKLSVEDGFELDAIKLSSTMIEDRVNAKTINGFDSSTLIHSSDDLNLDQLTVSGSVTVPEGVNINGTLNGISNLPRKVFRRIHKLIVKNLTLDGYINDVDIPTLDKYALKKKGDQRITARYIIDKLQGKNLDVGGKVSGRKLSHLIDTTKGNYTINQDIIFKNDIFVNKLQIQEYLNGIKVSDILLKNQTREQEITGDKIFDDIIIDHAIFLQGHINSENLEKMNPVVSISDNIFLEGDKVISGEVQIEDLLSVGDIITPDGAYSLKKLENEGIKLTTEEIKPHLHFMVPLNVDQIFVETINGQNPQDFVVTGLEEPQIIEGSKTFIGDLRITGVSDAFKINSVDVEELENNVLRTEGDQTIVGKHHIKRVIAESISANVTDIDKDLSLVVDQNLTINGNLAHDSIKADSVFVKGLVNDLQFDIIVNDTVRSGSDSVIKGHKYFHNLTTDMLNFDIGVTFYEGEIDKLVLHDPPVIENIKIDNLHFENEFNGVDRDSFGTIEDEVTTVDIDHVFHSITVYGDTYVASNKINDIDLTELSNDTVKIDEPFEFSSATFDDIVSKIVTLGGQIENLDLDNLLLPDDSSEVALFDEKTFKSDVTINGSVDIKGFLNGFNLTQFCQSDIDSRNITIDGDVFFARGPNVAKINGFDIKNVKEKGWFKDKDTTLTGSAEFEDIIFENDIDIGGFVDDINLNLLHENYFSKSKDQEIAATFTFDNDLTFENVTVPFITLDRAVVNGINLDEFVHTALLDDCDQVFETVAFFANCVIQNLTGDFTVNGLDLRNDVMRYDEVNMVTGPKTFQDLDIIYLKLDKNIKIQDVDVLDWFKNSVLKTTSYNITGDKSFKSANFIQGFQLTGALNGLRFDTDNLVVKNVVQEITGNKTIHASALHPLFFKGLKLKGLLNNIDLSDLINNQAYKNEDNVFKSNVNLYNNITTNNLVIKKLYQGVNMTSLITNVTNLGVLNNLLDHYYKLMDMSYALKDSIDGQAYFVHHYKIVQTIPLVTNTQKIMCPDGATRLGTLVTNGSNTKIDLFGWQNGKLSHHATIKFSGNPTYINQVLMGRYFYTEEGNGVGHFSQMSPKNKTLTVSTNLTSSTTSFVLPTDEVCTLFTYYDSESRIFCEKEGTIALRQTLDSASAARACATTIATTPHLLIITQPTVDVWRYDNASGKFELSQSLFVAHPVSISATPFHDSHYVAIASGHLQNAMYSGGVEVYRFDETTSQFTPWQNLNLDAPIQVEFVILPSNELVLYVVTDNPTEPLLVFGYEGISGFKLKVKGSTLPRILYLNQFVGATGSHYIVAQSHEEINVVEAVFKGE